MKMMDNSQVSGPAGAPGSDPSHSDADVSLLQQPAGRRLAPEVERAMAEVIDEALATRPLWAARHWHSAVLAQLAGTGSEPPSRHVFERRFSAERRRRRDAREAASAMVADRLGVLVGDQVVDLVPGESGAGRCVWELIARSVTVRGSSCMSDAWRDYLGESYRAGVRGISKEAFGALVFSPLFVANVPHDAMPDWWRAKLLRLSRS